MNGPERTVRYRAGLVLVCGLAVAALGGDGRGGHPGTGGESVVPTDHPDPFLAKYYQDNKEKIEAIYARAKAADATAEERLKAFQELRGKYPEAAKRAAANLVADKDAKVAAYAVKVAGAAAVMSDHKMPAGHAMPANPHAAYMMQEHERAKQALRTVVADDRKGVGVEAAKTLSALSDAKGLDAIVQASEKGVYKPAEAAGLIGLAAPKVATPYLNRYLAEGAVTTPEAKKTAVGILAKYPEQRDRIQKEYLFNPNADLPLRLAATGVIAAKPDAIVGLLADPSGLPPELYVKSVSTYARAKGGKLTDAERKQLQDAVQKIKAKHPNLVVPENLRPNR